MEKHHCPTCGAFPVDMEQKQRIQAAEKAVIDAAVLYTDTVYIVQPHSQERWELIDAVRELKAARGE